MDQSSSDYCIRIPIAPITPTPTVTPTSAPTIPPTFVQSEILSATPTTARAPTTEAQYSTLVVVGGAGDPPADALPLSPCEGDCDNDGQVGRYLEEEMICCVHPNTVSHFVS